jgi:hypothetical protein
MIVDKEAVKMSGYLPKAQAFASGEATRKADRAGE